MGLTSFRSRWKYIIKNYLFSSKKCFFFVKKMFFFRQKNVFFSSKKCFFLSKTEAENGLTTKTPRNPNFRLKFEIFSSKIQIEIFIKKLKIFGKNWNFFKSKFSQKIEFFIRYEFFRKKKIEIFIKNINIFHKKNVNCF